MTSSQPDAPAGVLLSVVRGQPTPEQLAALIAVVSARNAAGAAETPTASATSLWSHPQLRTPLSHGPGAWRASGLPR